MSALWNVYGACSAGCRAAWEDFEMASEESRVDPIGQLAEEFVARYRRGERPALSEYTEKYPELAERILHVFPMMVMMEEAGSGSEASFDGTRDPSPATTDAVSKK